MIKVDELKEKKVAMQIRLDMLVLEKLSFENFLNIVKKTCIM